MHFLNLAAILDNIIVFCKLPLSTLEFEANLVDENSRHTIFSLNGQNTSNLLTSTQRLPSNNFIALYGPIY